MDVQSDKEADERLQRVESAGEDARKSFIQGVYRVNAGHQLGYYYTPFYAKKKDPLAYHGDRCVLIGVDSIGGFAFIRVDKQDLCETRKGIDTGRAKYDALARIKIINS